MNQDFSKLTLIFQIPQIFQMSYENRLNIKLTEDKYQWRIEKRSNRYKFLFNLTYAVYYWV
mgnify:CR=1 FL=1